MFAQLCDLFPQHQNLITNHNSTKRKKELCDYLIIGTGVEEADHKIFNIVALYIEKTKRFEF